MKERWTIDPGVTFLNHGSFGACPRAVLEAQSALRARLERDPMRFFLQDLEELTARARERVAAFVGARPEDLGFVRNATSGVNAVVRSLRFAPGDELLVTDHGYNACKNVCDFVAARDGAKVVVAKLPWPIASEDDVVEAIVGAVTERTRLALIDHVTSPTGLVLPIAEIVRRLDARGVDTLVDGAHAPGMLELDLNALGAAWYAANFHKWTCAPKGAAMLWARADKQAGLHPATISHGYNSRRDRARFLEEIDWTGTDDPTSWLCVPVAIDYLEQLVGWPALRARNRALVLEGRDLLCDALGVQPPAPDSMIGSLAALVLPDAPDAGPPASALYANPLQRALVERYQIQVPIPPWPAPPRRLVRISAYLYNDRAQYAYLAEALTALLAEERG